MVKNASFIQWNDVSAIVADFVSGDERYVVEKRDIFNSVRGKKEDGWAETYVEARFAFRRRCNKD